MSKRKFQLVNDDSDSMSCKGAIEYIVTVKEKNDEKSYTLAHSDSSDWLSHVRGKKILKITDHGNGLKIKRLSKEPYIGEASGFNLDYDEFCELSMLLKFIHTFDNGMMIPVKTEEIIKVD